MQLLGSGSLNYTMSPMNTDGRLIGRLNIDGGYVKYSPPVISEKLFTFQPDSYIAFTGDMMNPTLNIKAIDEVKSNVSVSGQGTRSVNFDVELDVTGSLNTMNVVFDLSTDDDITIANELASMSAEQRANQAMNLLLYNMYTGSDTKSDASLTGNLFSFLESQINSWASSAIKGVDLSFGIDQYKSTLDGQTSSSMSYSYQVSKSLFNDRFKIVVGGNYSTDANADENFSQNLINDISFEYYLNSGRTMYVKLFRHTGYESILEGEITETGVGFVYKRKLRRLGDMFRFVTRMRNRYLQSKTKTEVEEAVPTDTIPESE
jgi:predicted house-cleaning noncanonical NTP pyrophosphatase (MazG superfamily)